MIDFEIDLGFLVDNLTFFTSEEGADSVKSFTVYASVEEYFPPMTAEELAEAPRLKFESTEYDFGSVKQGETVTAEFRFTNNGKTPLNIRKTAVSCGCTVAELETETFEPGESSVLKVNFNSSGRRGNQQKSVTIFSNDPSNPTQRVVIKARVED